MKRCNLPAHAPSVAARLLSALLLLSLVLPACGITVNIPGFEDATTKAVGVLDNAVNVLGNASADWQTVLQNVVAELTDKAQATIRNEVSDLLQRGIAATGSEFRCDADFLRTRMRQSLLAIKAQLLKQPVPPSEPALCQVVPLAVDMTRIPNSLKLLEFYGYDFDMTPIQVLLINSNGQIDVSGKLDRPTHYHMTLNLGANGVPLTAASQRILLRWQNHDISSIGVIQPQTPVCRTQIKQTTPSDITYRPPRTRGDAEFDGNGPDVSAGVHLINRGYQVDAQINMIAKETEDDWTTASGSMVTRIFTPDPGWKVTNIVGGLDNSKSYRDSNHSLDAFDLGSGGPARRFEFVGDTDDDDAGVRTQVQVFFNPLRFELTETGNCVAASAIKQADTMSTISASVLQRLKQDQEWKNLELSPELRILPAKP